MFFQHLRHWDECLGRVPVCVSMCWSRSGGVDCAGRKVEKCAVKVRGMHVHSGMHMHVVV